MYNYIEYFSSFNTISRIFANIWHIYFSVLNMQEDKLGGGGGVEHDQISDIRPPNNLISDITTTIGYQISGLSLVFVRVKYSLYQLI